MIYQREITVRLILLRTLFFVVSGLCIYSFRTGYKEYGFILAALLLIGLFIHLSQFRVANQNIEAVKYYCYGWIPVKRAFHKNDVLAVRPYSVDMQDNADGEAVEAADEWWGCLLFFIPAPKAEVRRYIIKYMDTQDREKHFRITLSREEHDLINPDH